MINQEHILINFTQVMKQLLVILFFCFSIIAVGQYPKYIPIYINDSLLAIFGNKVLENSFREDGINCGLSKSKEFLIRTDLDTARLIKKVGSNRLTFFKVEDSLRRLLSKPWNRDKGRVIYWIRQFVYNEDSVDFTIIHATLDNVTDKDIFFSPWCCGGGDIGPPPDGRFVYNKETKAWKYTTAQELKDQWSKMRNDGNCNGKQTIFLNGH
jgi:hypothetical protein